jgi:ubiquinone/menaquinone biosynthesis C-methylase UbiE
MEKLPDKWAQWLLERRYGGDIDTMKVVMNFLAPIRDKVILNANIQNGEILLDIGTGDGLIAFAALERVGSRGKVIFSDVSQDLLDHCHTLTSEMDISNQCDFINASANNLMSIQDISVDIVTTRSVLIYVEDKLQAFKEFYRVLKPNGRLSIFEPINQFSIRNMQDSLWGYTISSVRQSAEKIISLYNNLQPPDSDPMLNFNEYDLLAMTQEAGFSQIHLELQIDIKSAVPMEWNVFSRRAGNPNIPTLEEAIGQVLSSEEAEQFTEHLRPLVENGLGVNRTAFVYLSGIKH